MKKEFSRSIISVLIVVLITMSVLSFYEKKMDKHADLIKIYSPVPNGVVNSPLSVMGVARGNWYFEASFPVRLYDANNNELVAVPAHAKSDWMTTDFVPFEATLNFSKPGTPTGTLILKKDNASGLPEFDDEISIPIRFSP